MYERAFGALFAGFFLFMPVMLFLLGCAVSMNRSLEVSTDCHELTIVHGPACEYGRKVK